MPLVVHKYSHGVIGFQDALLNIIDLFIEEKYLYFH